MTFENQEKWKINRAFRDGRWVGIEFVDAFSAEWFMRDFINKEED